VQMSLLNSDVNSEGKIEGHIQAENQDGLSENDCILSLVNSESCSFELGGQDENWNRSRAISGAPRERDVRASILFAKQDQDNGSALYPLNRWQKSNPLGDI